MKQKFQPVEEFGNLFGSEKCKLLDYVFQFMDKYFPDVDLDDEGNPYPLPSLLSDNFIKLYDDKKLPHKFNCEDYLKETAIIDALEAFGIDIEKFWYFLLCLYYYYDFSYKTHVVRGQTIQEQLRSFIDFVAGNFKEYHDVLGAKFKDEMKITVNKKGKNLLLDNQTAIYYLAVLCNQGLSTLENEYVYVKSSFPIKKGSIRSHSCWIGFFVNSLLRFFQLYPQFKVSKRKSGSISYSKYALIANLLHLVGLTKDVISEDSVKGYLNRYKRYEKEIAVFQPMPYTKKVSS